MSVAKVVEICSESPTSLEDAIEAGVSGQQDPEERGWRMDRWTEGGNQGRQGRLVPRYRPSPELRQGVRQRAAGKHGP